MTCATTSPCTGAAPPWRPAACAVLAVLLLAVALVLAVPAAAQNPAAPAAPGGHPALAVPPGALRPTVLGCPLAAIAAVRVAAVPDGRSLKTTDGREVLLAGLEVPPIETQAGAVARDALATLVNGRDVELMQGTPQPDRWGRLVAWGFLRDDADAGARSLQHELLAAGQARVAGRVEDQACLPALRAAEREARGRDLGLWSDPVYAGLAADRPAEILRQHGRFALVRGRVDSVRESGGTIYVNFGRRWSETFAATIPKKIERSLRAAGLDPGRLAGRRIEVRGVVEQRGGPRIEILRAEQLAIEGR